MACAFMATTREAAIFFKKLMMYPEGLHLWCKFAGKNLPINSALSDDHLIMWGDPHKLPRHSGLYRNWGAFFDFGDVIEI